MTGEERRERRQSVSEYKAALRQKTQGIRNDDKKLIYGPYLRLWGSDAETDAWRGSVLVVIRKELYEEGTPELKLNHNNQDFTIQGQVLDTCENWKFWRFMLCLEVLEEESIGIYEVHNTSGFCTRQYPFCIAGKGKAWRWGFHSCAAFSRHTHTEEWKGASPLWRDVMKIHQERRLHAIIGGGDQIYNDGIFEMETLKEWLSIKSRHEKRTSEFSPLMEIEATHYYFHHYLQHFNTTAMRDALACIPQIMIWDDHDIFDGWGSYPESLQNCPVFQGLYKIALRFYLLFQQHTTQERISSENDLFDGVSSFAWERKFGPHVHIFATDQRAQRTQFQVMPSFTYNLIWQRLEQIPQSVKHLVIVSSTTVIYPEVPLAESVMEMLSNMNKVKALSYLMNKTGIATKLMEFDEPSLLDDLQDHWTAAVHREERRYFINTLQDFAKRRSIRVSFVAGDVHLCCAAQFYTISPKFENPENDFRLMPQITSSAIVNKPPPEKLVRMLHLSSQAHKGDINGRTKEKVLKLFKDKHHSHPKLLPRRNWLFVHEVEDRDLQQTLNQEILNVGTVRDYKVEEALPSSISEQTLTKEFSKDLPDNFEEMLDSIVRAKSGISEIDEEEDHDDSSVKDKSGYLMYRLRVEDPKKIGDEPESFIVPVPPLKYVGDNGNQVKKSGWKAIRTSFGKSVKSIGHVFRRRAGSVDQQ